MKHALCLSALLMTTSVAALATPVTYDFTGQLDQVTLAYLNPNPLLPTNPDPNSPLTINGQEFLNGSPYVVGTITFDPDYQKSSHLPVPVTFSVSFEGFTLTHTVFGNTFDTLDFSAETGLQTHVESHINTTGHLDPTIAEIDLNFDNGSFTDGSFRFAAISSGNIFGGSMSGTISSAAPVGVPEPGETALLLTGFAASIFLTMRRRVAVG
jgi:hypothetical protein